MPYKIRRVRRYIGRRTSRSYRHRAPTMKQVKAGTDTRTLMLKLYWTQNATFSGASQQAGIGFQPLDILTASTNYTTYISKVFEFYRIKNIQISSQIGYVNAGVQAVFTNYLPIYAAAVLDRSSAFAVGYNAVATLAQVLQYPSCVQKTIFLQQPGTPIRTSIRPGFLDNNNWLSTDALPAVVPNINAFFCPAYELTFQVDGTPALNDYITWDNTITYTIEVRGSKII